jgi:hypothetical protein
MDASKLIERRAQASNTYRSNWQPRDASEVTLRKVQMSQKNNSSTHKGPVVGCCSETRIVTTEVGGGEPQYNWNPESTAGLVVGNFGSGVLPVLGPGPADVTFGIAPSEIFVFADSPISYNVNGVGNTCSLQFRLPVIANTIQFIPNFYDPMNFANYFGLINIDFLLPYSFSINNTFLSPTPFGTLNLNPNDLVQMLLDGTNFIIFVNGVEQFRQNYSSLTLPPLIAELYLQYRSPTDITFSNISYGPITITEGGQTQTTITQVPTRPPRASSPTPGFSTDYSEQIVFQKKAGCAQCHDPNFGKAGGVQLLTCSEVATILAPVPNPVKGTGCYCADPGIYQQPGQADCSIIEPAYTGSLNQVPIIKAQGQNHGHLPEQQYPYPSG